MHGFRPNQHHKINVLFSFCSLSSRIYDDEGVLIEKLIKTVGILVYLAGNHPMVLETTRYALEFLKQFIHSANYDHQCAAAISIYFTFSNLPASLVFPSFTEDLRELNACLSGKLTSISKTQTR